MSQKEDILLLPITSTNVKRKWTNVVSWSVYPSICCRKWLTNPKRKTNQGRTEKNGEQVANEADQTEKPEKKMSTFYMPLVRTL